MAFHEGLAPTHEHASHHPHTRARTAGGALGPHHNKHSWDQSAVWRAHERAILWPGSVGDSLTSADAPTSHMHWCLTSKPSVQGNLLATSRHGCHMARNQQSLRYAAPRRTEPIKTGGNSSGMR